MGEWKETEFGLVASDWKFIPSTEFCLRVTDGTHDSPKEQKTGKHLITSKHIKGKDVDFDNAYLISEEDYVKINERSKVDQWDVIISMIGEYCGFSFVERNEVIDYAVKNVGLFKTGNQHKAYWLYYFLNSKIVRYILETNKSGTSQPYLTLGFLRELPVLYPSSEAEAKVIVEILSSIDDKIDLLHRQNKTFEQLAETLFRQWFVEEVNESWEEKTINDVCIKINSGGTPSTKVSEYYNGNINWYSTKELNDNFLFESVSKITESGLENSSAKLFPENTIIIAIYAAPTVGRLGILGNEASFNQAACGFVVDENKICFEYLYLYLLNSRQKLNDMASGSAQQNLNVGIMKEFPLIIPASERIVEFRNISRPLFLKIKENSIQIRTLTQLRDTLLPKLMSGEVRVKNETND